MREIVLDTETTGLDPAHGDRVVEIGCVELVNHLATGRNYHQLINPERDMPAEAFRVHGLGNDLLAGQPVFSNIAAAFLEFIGDAPLIIHNAAFDMGFINAELKLAGLGLLSMDRSIDTVSMARRKFPGAPANLDALCRRFSIDTSARVKHGALLDAELLAEVYLELIGGRQPGLTLVSDDQAGPAQPGATEARPKREARAHAPTEEEEQAHARFIDTMKDPIWKR